MNPVQSFVKRLVADEGFRALALSNPSAAIDQIKEVSAEQRASLTHLCQRLSAQPDGSMVINQVGPTAYWA